MTLHNKMFVPVIDTPTSTPTPVMVKEEPIARLIVPFFCRNSKVRLFLLS